MSVIPNRPAMKSEKLLGLRLNTRSSARIIASLLISCSAVITKSHFDVDWRGNEASEGVILG